MSMQALLDNGDEILVPARTTHYGQRLLRFLVVHRFTTCVMKMLIGIQI